MDVVDRIITKIAQAQLERRIRPRLKAGELASLEREAGVTVPGEYRRLLLEVGNVGTGSCRLTTLAARSGHYWIDEPRPEHLARPCLFTPEAEEHGAEWLDRLGVEDWEARWDRGDWDPMFGTMAVREVGCGLFYSLIVTGPHRGRVFLWGDHAERPPRFQPQPGFLDWLESLLDKKLAGEPVFVLDGKLS